MLPVRFIHTSKRRSTHPTAEIEAVTRIFPLKINKTDRFANLSEENMVDDIPLEDR